MHHRSAHRAVGGQGDPGRGEGRRARGVDAAGHGAQAEADRERRAKVIHGQGEFEAAEALAAAAAALEAHPAAMQLRVLSTMVDVSAEKNSTLIFPVPMELLRLAEATGRRLGADAASSHAHHATDSDHPQ